MYPKLLMIIASASVCASASAADSLAGRELAATCANCHGTDGKSLGAVASLVGQPSDTMVATLAAFRDGRRPATIMHQIAKGFTDEQIKLIADYFANVK